MDLVTYSYSTVETEVEVPEPGDEQNQTEVEIVSLDFTFRFRYSVFLVAQDGSQTLQSQRDDIPIPISDHYLPADHFDRRHDLLTTFLTTTLNAFDSDLDPAPVAARLIARWREIRPNVDARAADGVLPMTVNLVFWDIRRCFTLGRPAAECREMVPASKAAVGGLEEVKMEEILGKSMSCVICMKKFRKRKVAPVRMPCSHVFHRECLVKWLKNSHSCPTCRFLLPTD